MASIVSPARIESLEAQPIRVLIHKSANETEELMLPGVFPFLTLQNLKQRIATHRDGDRAWLPNQLFLGQATEVEGKYNTLEFMWPFGKQLADPLSPDIPNREDVGKPDIRIFESGDRKPIFPSMLSGITIESAIKNVRTVHVWTLKTVAQASGYSEGTMIRDDAFEGFFQLYFPTLKSKDDVARSLDMSELTPREKEAFRVAKEYSTAVDSRLHILNAALPTLKDASPIKMRELRNLRYTLPKSAKFSNGQLELRFYEAEPSDKIPFIRFFPAQERQEPLIKIATSASGASILKKEIFDSFLTEEPVTTLGGVLLMKSPVNYPDAPVGTAWTLRIFEDGSADLSIGAPSKDKPLTTNVFTAAVDMLPAFLDTTRWPNAEKKVLADLTAVYEFTSRIVGGIPSPVELKHRLDTFLPIMYEEKGIPGDTALNLRYKAVSNFASDKGDPIFSYITTLFLRDSTQSVQSINTEKYIVSIAKIFGLPPTEAAEYMKAWIHNHAEYVMEDAESAIASHNLGAAIGIYYKKSHPKYLFLLSAIESELDLTRILSLLTIFTSKNATELTTDVAVSQVVELPPDAPVVAPAPAPAEAPAPPEVPAVEAEEPAAWDALMDFGMGNEAPTEDQVLEEGQQLAPQPLASAPVAVPNPLGDDEMVDPADKEWYLTQLSLADRELFEYKEIKENPRVKTYSVACQKSAGKQPNVMHYSTYERVRKLYGDAVFWVEAPLSAKDTFATQLASKTPGERKKEGALYGKSVDEVIEAEKRALELGIPLTSSSSKGVTITSLSEPAAKERGVSDDTRREIQELIDAQKKKPLWTVIRTGTISDEPNYYICAEYWCIRDGMPLIPSEFLGSVYRNGAPKVAGSCPFCGGRILTDPAHPKIGETVMRRKPTDKKNQIARYIGFQGDLYHPSNYALPCCFVSPNNLEVPQGARPIPPPKVKLPDLQEDDEMKDEAKHEDKMEENEEDNAKNMDIEKKRRPFSIEIYKEKDGKRTTSSNRFFIPNQVIGGRIDKDWLGMYQRKDRWSVVVPPPAINQLLGQDPEKFLSAPPGGRTGDINSYLKPNATAFLRFVVCNSVKTPGRNLISLIAYAKYATEYFLTENNELSIPTTEEVITDMLETNGILMAHAFEQANYGTLLHEFSVPGSQLKGEEELQFQTWWASMMKGAGMTEEQSADQRAYAVNVYLAWNNFKNYVADKKERKQLRLWEGLFTVPGLLTKTGFVVVRLLFPKDKSKPASIHCPEFGISLRSQTMRLPILFIAEDEYTGMYDPLVLCHGNETGRKVFGVLKESTDAFAFLPSNVQEPLKAFIAQYYSSDSGCARKSITVHPWMPERDTNQVPLLGSFVNLTAKMSIEIDALLHDRSNRCVGVIVRDKSVPLERNERVYIPVLDDGTILENKPVLRGERALPKPSLITLLDLLAGKKLSEKRMIYSDNFPALKPSRLIATPTNYVAVELACGATIPIEPLPLKTPVTHRLFTELQKSAIMTDFRVDMPWDVDVTLLGPEIPSEDLEQQDEEVLEEAYQHLRISFSNWLFKEDRGNKVRKQIELLRQAKLPLYELQKRLDILLTPIVNNSAEPWMTMEGKPRSSVLRRDCRQKTQEACIGGCTWSTGRCLIHSPKTPRYMNPLRVLTARLGDELLRTFGKAKEILDQRVSYLKPLESDSLLRTGSGLMFSATGRGTEALYDKLGYKDRTQTSFARGLTYPEEISVDKGDASPPSDWESLLEVPVFRADIDRDLKSRFEASLIGISGKPFPQLETELGHLITGTVDTWAKLAKHIHVNVVITESTKEGAINPVHLLRAGGAEANIPYVVVAPNGIPYRRRDTKKFTLTRESLPPRLAMFVEAHEV